MATDALIWNADDGNAVRIDAADDIIVDAISHHRSVVLEMEAATAALRLAGRFDMAEG